MACPNAAYVKRLMNSHFVLLIVDIVQSQKTFFDLPDPIHISPTEGSSSFVVGPLKLIVRFFVILSSQWEVCVRVGFVTILERNQKRGPRFHVLRRAVKAIQWRFSPVTKSSTLYDQKAVLRLGNEQRLWILVTKWDKFRGRWLDWVRGEHEKEQKRFFEIYW